MIISSQIPHSVTSATEIKMDRWPNDWQIASSVHMNYRLYTYDTAMS